MVTPPPDTDSVALDMHEVKEAKSQRLIQDGIRDHLIPHVVEKKSAYNMWTTLKGLYEAKNEPDNGSQGKIAGNQDGQG